MTGRIQGTNTRVAAVVDGTRHLHMQKTIASLLLASIPLILKGSHSVGLLETTTTKSAPLHESSSLQPLKAGLGRGYLLTNWCRFADSVGFRVAVNLLCPNVN